MAAAVTAAGHLLHNRLLYTGKYISDAPGN
jgi:hypothetical protein